MTCMLQGVWDRVEVGVEEGFWWLRLEFQVQDPWCLPTPNMYLLHQVQEHPQGHLLLLNRSLYTFLNFFPFALANELKEVLQNTFLKIPSSEDKKRRCLAEHILSAKAIQPLLAPVSHILYDPDSFPFLLGYKWIISGSCVALPQMGLRIFDDFLSPNWGCIQFFFWNGMFNFGFCAASLLQVASQAR